MADADRSPIRIRLGQTDKRGTPLDGAWWPRSTDPAAELPDLIAAIDAAHGTIVRLALGADGWDARPKRLFIGDRKIRLGFFASQSRSLLTATTENYGRVDLLVIAPDTPADTAEAAMTIAANPDNRLPAEKILEAATGPAREQPLATTR